jgi:hypothetical protein
MAAYGYTMGYDESEPLATNGSQVDSIFSSSSNHSGRSRFSDKGQKPHIESTPLRGGLASTKGPDLNLDESVGGGPASATARVLRSGGLASAAGVNGRLSQENSEQQRAYTTKCNELKSVRDTLASTLVETEVHHDMVVALELQIDSISEASNLAQEEIRLMVIGRNEQ